MKVYCFYLYNTTITNKKYPAVPSDDIKISDEFMYVLYGITSNKKYAQKFRKTRNSNFFLKIINMSKKEYISFSENRVDLVIDERLYKSFSIKNGKISTDLVFVLSTESEYDKICFDYPMFINSIYKDINQKMTDINPDLFKLKISKALKDVFSFYGILDWLKMLDEIPFDNFTINTLSLYFHIFGNTLNKERIDELCTFGDSLRNLK